MQIIHQGRTYTVGEAVAGAAGYSLYLCQEAGIKDSLLLQIATESAQNASLDRTAYFLRELAVRADAVEESYAKVKNDPRSFLNYNLGFPEVRDSFICPEQGNRRINILAFRGVEDVAKMVPLINVTARDRLRVDLKTSAWMIGKLLKLLTFAHSEGLVIGHLDGNNILFEPDKHFVVLFDWSATQTYDGIIPAQVRRSEISAIANSVIVALGGDLETGQIPDDGDRDFAQYADYLWRLSRGEESSAKNAHQAFYDLITKKLGWKGFHPFTTHKLG